MEMSNIVILLKVFSLPILVLGLWAGVYAWFKFGMSWGMGSGSASDYFAYRGRVVAEEKMLGMLQGITLDMLCDSISSNVDPLYAESFRRGFEARSEELKHWSKLRRIIALPFIVGFRRLQ